MKNLRLPLRTAQLLCATLLLSSTAAVIGQTTDVLDQSQTSANLWQNIYQENDAQSFIPTQSKLDRVEVELMVGSGALSNLQLTIFPADATGLPVVSSPLASVTPVPAPDAALSSDLVVGWFVAELNSLPVQPGQTYFIRLTLAEDSVDQRANWAAADGTIDPAYDNLYPNGSWWFGVGSLNPPMQFPHRDATFKTYYPQTADPVKLLQALEANVQSMGLNKGLEKKLIGDLNATISAVQQNNLSAALSNLQAFTSLVQSQTPKKVTSAQSTQLLEMAGEIAPLL